MDQPDTPSPPPTLGTGVIPLNAGGQMLGFLTFDNDASRKISTRILSGESYPLVRFVNDVRVVVDIGANVGAAALYFALRYPQAAVHALEPGRLPYRLLSQNARLAPNLAAFNVGLYSRDAEVPLFRSHVDSVTASVGHSYLNSEAFETVTLRRADAWFAEHALDRVDVLKIDTEGCEVPILESIAPLLPGIRVIYLEFHSEEDRLRLDQLLHATHVLFGGHIVHLHRGEYCYVAKSAFPSAAELDRLKIVVQV